MKPKQFKITHNNVVIFHHLYIGILLIGWMFPFNIMGFLIFLDDLYEHLIDYNSPLRLLFDKIIVPKIF